MRQAEVYINKILAGVLTESDNRKFTFRYDDRYFNSKDSKVRDYSSCSRRNYY